jgi:hypothetical protein
MVVVRFSEDIQRWIPDYFQKIQQGIKKQTIRQVNAYANLRVGNKVHCYSTKKVPHRRPALDKKLYEGTCTEIDLVTWGKIENDDKIARLDGFNNSREMRKCFTEMYPNIKNSTPLKIIKWK